VTEIAARLARERFAAIYGAFWDGVIPRDGQAIVRRSAERYVRALSEVLG
jgi:hypothetical protein